MSMCDPYQPNLVDMVQDLAAQMPSGDPVAARVQARLHLVLLRCADDLERLQEGLASVNARLDLETVPDVRGYEPRDGSQRPEPVPSPVRRVTEKEIDALLLATSHTRDRALIGLMFYDGLRVGEALALRVQDIDLEHGYLRICRHAGPDRVVWIGPYAVRVLRTWLGLRRMLLGASVSEHVFCDVVSHVGRRLGVRRYVRRLKLLAERAKLDPEAIEVVVYNAYYGCGADFEQEHNATPPGARWTQHERAVCLICGGSIRLAKDRTLLSHRRYDDDHSEALCSASQSPLHDRAGSLQ